MELALRQRLEGVATISISESQQTTEVVFEPGDHPFSFDLFREALRQADVEVVTMDVDACGVVEREAGELRLRAGRTQFVIPNGEQTPAGSAVCVSGRVDEADGRARLALTSVVPGPDAMKQS
jgi:hypothetical protein